MSSKRETELTLQSEFSFVESQENPAAFLQRLEDHFNRKDQQAYLRLYWRIYQLRNQSRLDAQDSVYTFIAEANVFLLYLQKLITDSYQQDWEFNKEIFFDSDEGKKFLVKAFFSTIAGLFLGHRPHFPITFKEKSAKTHFLENIHRSIEAKKIRLAGGQPLGSDSILLDELHSAARYFNIPDEVVMQLAAAATVANEL